MIYLYVGLASWIFPGLVLGGRHARRWYAEAFEERLETVADHNLKSRGQQYHSCYLGPYRHGNEKKCYRAMPAHAQAVKRGLLHALIWPFLLVGEVALATANLIKSTSERLGNASFGSIEKQVRESFNSAREIEKDAFLQKYAEECRNLYFSYQMVTKYWESVHHNHKVDSLRRVMLDDRNRPTFVNKEAIELALQVYRHDSDSMKEVEGGAK